MTKILTTILLSTIILTFMMTVPSAFAAPVYNPANGHYYEFISSNVTSWTDAEAAAESYFPPVLNPDNGHYYELVDSPPISWTEANNEAESSIFCGVNGTVATITSQSENDFVANLIGYDSFVWIGLFDTDTQTEPILDPNIVRNYNWVTGEPLNYTNWSTGQPSAGTDDDFVGFYGNNDKWFSSYHWNYLIDGYVIEYSP